MHIRAPLKATCSRTPPEWFSSLATWAAQYDVGGLQVYARIDQTSYDCSFGSAIIADGSKEPMTTHSKLPYASLTKVFTSTLALKQAALGFVHLDANVNDTLGLDGFALKNRHRWERATLAMLLRHRAGFDSRVSGDPMFWRSPPCPVGLERLEPVPVDFEPDTGFAYSNLGYCLATVVLERSSGTTFSELLQTELLEPLDLPVVELSGRDDLRAYGIALHVQHRADKELLDSLDWRSFRGVGNLAGTAHDFGRLLEQLVDPNGPLGEIGARLMEPLPNCDETKWRHCHGLAFYSHRESEGRRMFWRDGSLPGATAFAAITETDDVFVLLGNGRDPARWLSIHDELGRIVYERL